MSTTEKWWCMDGACMAEVTIKENVEPYLTTRWVKSKRGRLCCMDCPEWNTCEHVCKPVKNGERCESSVQGESLKEAFKKWLK